MANGYPLKYVSSNLNKIIAEMVNTYGKEISGKAHSVTKKVAQDFAEKLKVETPRSTADTEHLADTVVITGKGEKFAGGSGKVLYVHYTKWQLAHLLEFGWTAKNGRKITRTPYIRPLFDNNKDRYYNMYKEALKND